ncbi:hypothetical protein MNAN1_003116 [Malassezia nana]|uniref:DUF1746 domain-containing protein n=1 Tax=Malassezia nana TaxID=180528 RepID=A0AAF0EL99_9BASI|nr:hypothetical protein MNAN1_003116 [Malassezia nana]
MRKERREALAVLQRLMMTLIVYIYLLDGLLFILLLRLLSAMVRRDALTQQYMRPQLTAPGRRLPGFVRSMTLFQIFCALAQLFYDTDPSRRRLIVDFVGQEYAPSKIHLIAVDVFLWFVQLMVLALTVPELQGVGEAVTTAVHRHDALATESATTDHAPLLIPADPKPSVLPTTQEPIAVIPWASLWQDRVAPMATNDNVA